LRRFKELLLLIGIASLMVLPLTATAQGACSFTVSASPASVEEGKTVTVTVRRSGAANPSSIDVETTDGSAKAPEDYTPIPKQTIRFGAETSKTLTIVIKDDTASEQEETFSVELSNAECGDPAFFTIGGAAVVRIQANDVVSLYAPPEDESQESSSKASTQASGSASSTPSPSPNSTDSAGSPFTSSPTVRNSSPDRAASAVDSDAGFYVWTSIVILVLLISVGVGVWYYRKSSRPNSPS
jgi:hypothetical protein